MEIRISFAGGDYDGMSAMTDGLDEIKVFFPVGTRAVFAYRRFNETIYAYSEDMSSRMTEGYDQTRTYYFGREMSSIRFEDEVGPIEPVEFNFSDEPIDEDDAGSE